MQQWFHESGAISQLCLLPETIREMQTEPGFMLRSQMKMNYSEMCVK